MLCAVCKLAGERERLLALFSFTSGPTSDIISEFAGSFQLPVVSASPAVDESLRGRLRRHHLSIERPALADDDDDTVDSLHVHHDEMSFAFHIRPLYTAAVVDVIQYYKWQQIFYVFDDADGINKNMSPFIRTLLGPPRSAYSDFAQNLSQQHTRIKM